MDNNLIWTKEGFYRLTVLVSVHMNGGIATIKDIKKMLKKQKMKTRNVKSTLRFLKYNGLVMKSKDGNVSITEEGKKVMQMPLKNGREILENPPFR